MILLTTVYDLGQMARGFSRAENFALAKASNILHAHFREELCKHRVSDIESTKLNPLGYYLFADDGDEAVHLLVRLKEGATPVKVLVQTVRGIKFFILRTDTDRCVVPATVLSHEGLITFESAMDNKEQK